MSQSLMEQPPIRPPLTLVMRALDCSKPTASMVVNGKYERDTGLNSRWIAICELMKTQRGMQPDVICAECPKEDCDGCRIADIATHV